MIIHITEIRKIIVTFKHLSSCLKEIDTSLLMCLYHQELCYKDSSQEQTKCGFPIISSKMMLSFSLYCNLYLIWKRKQKYPPVGGQPFLLFLFCFCFVLQKRETQQWLVHMYLHQNHFTFIKDNKITLHSSWCVKLVCFNTVHGL